METGAFLDFSTDRAHMSGDLTVKMDGVETKWRRGQRILGRWHTGVSYLFSGTQVDTIFFNGI
jgi:hypothetical protein